MLTQKRNLSKQLQQIYSSQVEEKVPEKQEKLPPKSTASIKVGTEFVTKKQLSGDQNSRNSSEPQPQTQTETQESQQDVNRKQHEPQMHLLQQLQDLHEQQLSDLNDRLQDQTGALSDAQARIMEQAHALESLGSVQTTVQSRAVSAEQAAGRAALELSAREEVWGRRKLQIQAERLHSEEEARVLKEQAEGLRESLRRMKQVSLFSL